MKKRLTDISTSLAAALKGARRNVVSRLKAAGGTVVVAAASMLSSCSIEPPLKLAGEEDVVTALPEVVTDINMIWELDTDWQTSWWYGWDERDIALWGKLEYPEPESFEVRDYYLGDTLSSNYQSIASSTIFGREFRRRFPFGYHDLLFWSNIDSPDGTQVLVIDESDASDIKATTSRSRLGYKIPGSRAGGVYNNPEIFYAGIERGFHVSHLPADYDYFDEYRKVWVKYLHTELTPMVYTYLVQFVIYHNNGRITGLADDASISSLADGVSVHTGHTSSNDIVVAYGMRIKNRLPIGSGTADIIGGKLTTFGLCDMEPWSKSRGTRYSGGRGDLLNHLRLDLAFSNQSDSVYAFDITRQMQTQAHGGVITIEIDADTLTIPRTGSTAKSGAFDPTIVPQDSIEHEFGM